MAGKITKEGVYQLFRSPSGQEVLALEKEEFALLEGPRGEEVIARQGNFERQQVLEMGEFIFVEFAENGDPPEMPHLFLRRNNHYIEIIFSGGMPTEDGEPREYRRGEEIGVEDVEDYLEALPSGSTVEGAGPRVGR